MKLCIGVNSIPCPDETWLRHGRGLRCRSCSQRIRHIRAVEHNRKNGKRYNEERKAREKQARERARQVIEEIEADEKIFSPKSAERLINLMQKVAE